MRKAFGEQQRLDCRGVAGVQLNLDCRDEIIPVLRALQQIYSGSKLREEILDLVAQDVNRDARDDGGREGMDYWQILVLASVRLGCNLDYDKLQDLAEQHRALRHILGIGDWCGEGDFSWRRIRDNVCLLQPATIEKISHLVVAEGHRWQPEAAQQVRADSFVMETNIHWPSESTLIRDGLRKLIPLCVSLARTLGHSGLPKPGAKQAAAQAAEATLRWRAARQRHPGVESIIGALPAGNGLERSRDRSELGFARYLALGILGRNLQTLGKLLIAQEAPASEAAHGQRQKLAA